MSSPPLPERLHVIQSGLVDTTRWDHFTPRDDDVFVCTFGKHGTTWRQAICALLIFKTPELDFNPAERSPWLDATFQPIEEVIRHLDGLEGRRVIKTHTPLDAIPYFEPCTYITVYRDPRDAFFSMRSHMENMKLDLGQGEPQEPETAFRAWVAADYTEGGAANRPALASTTHHLKSYLCFRHLPNIHFFHYADLKRDLAGEMRAVARALGEEVDDALLAQLAKAASFENMKSNADRFVPGASEGFWHDTSRFLHKGTHGQWLDVLSDEALAEFDAKLDALLTPELAHWLKRGGALPAWELA